MRLQKRDRDILNSVCDLGLISTKQIRNEFFKEVAMTTVLKRLRLLEQEKLIKRIKGLENAELLWSITDRGAVLIQREFYKTSWNKGMLVHDYMLSSFRQSLKSLSLFESWVSEHELRSIIYKKLSFKGRLNKLIPDGLMTIKKNGNLETWAIELELSLKTKDRYERIFKEYGKKENLKGIWYLVQGESLFKSLKENIKRSSYLLNGKEVVISLVDEIFSNLIHSKIYFRDEVFSLAKIFGVHEFQLAHMPTHRVSNFIDVNSKRKIELSAHKHTPIMETVQ